MALTADCDNSRSDKLRIISAIQDTRDGVDGFAPQFRVFREDEMEVPFGSKRRICDTAVPVPVKASGMEPADEDTGCDTDADC
jgi:hypothetical protein